MVVFNACHLDLDQLLPLSLSLVTSGQTVAHMHTHYLYSDLLHHHWSLSYAWSILYNHCLLHHAAHPILLSPNLPLDLEQMNWHLLRSLPSLGAFFDNCMVICSVTQYQPWLDLAALLVLKTFSWLSPLFSPMMLAAPLSTDKLDRNDMILGL